jgi:hypothetical protein
LHYRLGWVASPGALPRERFSSMTRTGLRSASAKFGKGSGVDGLHHHENHCEI